VDRTAKTTTGPSRWGQLGPVKNDAQKRSRATGEEAYGAPRWKPLTPARPPHPGLEKAPGDADKTGMVILRILVGVLAAAVLGLAVALVVVAGSASSDNDRQTDTLAQSDKRIAELERRVRESGNGDQADLGDLRRHLRKVEDCLPEVQTELDSLNIDRETLYISPSNQLSRVCQPLVYPQVSTVSGD
jgi:uncharacterized protein HemX